MFILVLLYRKNKQYVVIMDNYFTLVKTMIATRECGVTAMDTARSRYIKDGAGVCVCVCVCVSLQLTICFSSCC